MTAKSSFTGRASYKLSSGRMFTYVWIYLITRNKMRKVQK